MQRQITVNLGNFVLSLSEAMDLADPSLIQHQQMTAFAVWEMGKAAGISSERLEQVFIAALLHDIGAFSLKEKNPLKTLRPKISKIIAGAAKFYYGISRG